mmetsp:Transcript_157/g.425  ORF Transcript_157/g.425 Transcript_157/m.425 type:complete len:296 (-) Transcript_157:173-1060(-)
MARRLQTWIDGNAPFANIAGLHFVLRRRAGAVSARHWAALGGALRRAAADLSAEAAQLQAIPNDGGHHEIAVHVRALGMKGLLIDAAKLRSIIDRGALPAEATPGGRIGVRGGLPAHASGLPAQAEAFEYFGGLPAEGNCVWDGRGLSAEGRRLPEEAVAIDALRIDHWRCGASNRAGARRAVSDHVVICGKRCVRCRALVTFGWRVARGLLGRLSARAQLLDRVRIPAVGISARTLQATHHCQLEARLFSELMLPMCEPAISPPANALFPKSANLGLEQQMLLRGEYLPVSNKP